MSGIVKRQFATSEEVKQINSNLKNGYALIISSEPSFAVEVSSSLKNLGLSSTFIWSLELLSAQPLEQVEMVIMSSDTWAGRKIYGKSFFDKLSDVKEIFILTQNAESEAKKCLCPNFIFTDCYNELEFLISNSIKGSSKHLLIKKSQELT